MTRAQGAFKTASPWHRIGWGMTAALLVVAFFLGFFVLGRGGENSAPRSLWASICRGLGITSDTLPAARPQPPLRTPTRIAWTNSTLAQISSGKIDHGASVALSCGTCHGQDGKSPSGLYPTLAGMEASAIFKQLDDFRANNRSSGVMNAIAEALTLQDSADVAAYYASRTKGLPPEAGRALESGHTLRESDPTVRLAYAGDPIRGLPPCTSCHGPTDFKLGAPRLRGQHADYIERELAAFAQGVRTNDINEQMRTIAAQLTTAEMHALAEYYGESHVIRMSQR
jgi:cytochrome c553